MNELSDRLRARSGPDLVLAAGGLLLAVAGITAFGRMEESWAAFPLLLLLAAPCAALFAMALLPGDGGDPRVGEGGHLAPWQAAFLLAALLLLVGSLFQLVVVFGEDDPGSATATWTFFLTGMLAAALALRLSSPACTLLAALFLAVAFVAFIDWIDSDADSGAFRDILLLEGLAFIFVARSQRAIRLEHSHVLVAVGALTLVLGATAGVLGDDGLAALLFGFDTGGLDGEADGWEMVLIAVSIGALVYAAVERYRGAAYPGLLGLIIFFVATTDGSLAGWPLILALLGAAAIGWSLYGRPDDDRPATEGVGRPPADSVDRPATGSVGPPEAGGMPDAPRQRPPEL